MKKGLLEKETKINILDYITVHPLKSTTNTMAPHSQLHKNHLQVTKQKNSILNSDSSAKHGSPGS